MAYKRKRVTKVAVDTSKTISQFGIQIPKIDYKVVADVSMQTAFSGRITPLPTVIVHYLRPAELIMFSVIIEDIIELGECKLTTNEFIVRMNTTAPTLYTAKSAMKKMGLIDVKKGADKKYRYTINWKAVNNLDKLTQNAPPSIMSYIRESTRTRILENLTEKDILRSYNEKVLPIEHDPREEETYD